VFIAVFVIVTSSAPLACGPGVETEPIPGAGGIGGGGVGGTGAASEGGTGGAQQQACASPQFSLPSGHYNTLKTVELTETIAGCKIFVTLDGNDPTESSTLYTKVIDLPEGTTTLKAFAAGLGFVDSETNSATYQIILDAEQVDAPQFSPPGGTYASAQVVVVTTPTAGAEIHCTVDGTEPNAASPTCSAPMTVGDTTTIKAIAIKAGMKDSVIAAASYTLQAKAVAPEFSLPSATYSSPQWLKLTTTTPGGRIFYTTDGADPSVAGAEYTWPISVSETMVVKAITSALGYLDSEIASGEYIIEPAQPQAAPPTFAPPAGIYITAQNVSLASSTPGATIYYTVDGTDPTTASLAYTGPFPVSNSLTVKAVTTAPNCSPSAVATALYTIDPALQAAMPVIFPTPANPYTAPVLVSMTTSEPSGVIHYTLDGTLPTETNGTVYQRGFAINSSHVVTAVTAAIGKANSSPAIASYQIGTIPESVLPVLISPATATAVNDISVTLTTPTGGATICYTTDGSAPSCAVSKDSCLIGQMFPFGGGPLIISKSGTVLSAIACRIGCLDAPLSTATYTLNTAPVVFDPTPGPIASATPITMTSLTSGATIRFRTDSVDPTCTTGELFLGGVSVTQDTEFRAVSCKANYGPTPLVIQTAAYFITGK
jgi:hypothetical protein